MIYGEAWYMIRELRRQGLVVREIARRAGRDRKTILQAVSLLAKRIPRSTTRRTPSRRSSFCLPCSQPRAPNPI